MRYYESLYIVNPNFEQSRLDKAMKTVSEKISEYGFKVINHFEWGKKRLAYNINEHKYGSYVLLHFETESIENLERFERFMVLQKSILRNQTVLLDKKPQAQSEKDSTNEEDKKNTVKFEGKAGMFLMHHAKIIHFADPNKSKTRSRRAFGFVYHGVSAKHDKQKEKMEQEQLKAELKSKNKL